MTITGNKMRAGGKLIVSELPTKDPAHDVGSIEAVKAYQEISQQLRGCASATVAESLFIYLRQSGSVDVVDIRRWGDWFRMFCDRHEKLKTLGIRSNMLRTSVLLQDAYDRETGIFAASARADHSSLSTSMGYVARYPTRVIWERTIRDFQNLYQAVPVYNIDGAAQKLGLTTEQAWKLFTEACRTGLGVLCLDPKSGVQPGSEKGIDCTQLQNCHGCPNRMVIATVENLKDLILWNRHLERHREKWERERPERWLKVWLPWLVFTQVIAEQSSRGRTLKEFRRAETLANDQCARGAVNLPPLW
jgi:hypothetical protein